MPAPILIDLTHTSHTRARTGIQRVARSLHTALGSDARARHQQSPFRCRGRHATLTTQRSAHSDYPQRRLPRGPQEPPRPPRRLRTTLVHRRAFRTPPHRPRPSADRSRRPRPPASPPGRRTPAPLRRSRHRCRARFRLRLLCLYDLPFTDRRLRPARHRKSRPRQTLHLLRPRRPRRIRPRRWLRRAGLRRRRPLGCRRPPTARHAD